MSATKVNGCLALILLAAACGPRGPVRTPLPPAPGVDPAVLRAVFASQGASVGAIRTAVMPDGTAVAVTVPEPSDGYPPQVSVVRIERGEPDAETETICSIFDWAGGITGDEFMGLDPLRIEAVERGAWDGSAVEDLLVTVATEVEIASYGQHSGRASLSARCAFRGVDDPDGGRMFPSILPLVLGADVDYAAYGDRTRTVEEHSVDPAPGRPDSVDLTVRVRTETCAPGEGGGAECVPESSAVTRRFRLVGSGIDMSYQPASAGPYGYRYNYGVGGGDTSVSEDPGIEGYESPPVYEDPPSGYEDPSYLEESVGDDEEGNGDDEDAGASTSCHGR